MDSQNPRISGGYMRRLQVGDKVRIEGTNLVGIIKYLWNEPSTGDWAAVSVNGTELRIETHRLLT